MDGLYQNIREPAKSGKKGSGVVEVRDNNFGIVRLLAALFVIVGHMHILAGGMAPELYGIPIHEVGVDIFFIIGGYLIARSWMRGPDFAKYICRRIFRIFPALFFCVCITVFLVGPLATSLTLGEYFSDRLTWKYLMNIFLSTNHALPGVFADNPYPAAVNGSLWSLPVEFMMYFLLPLWINIGKRMAGYSDIFWTACAVVAVLVACVYGAGGVLGKSFLLLQAGGLRKFYPRS